MSETKRSHWSKLIAEQEASGQKVGPFCRSHGVAEGSFHYWRKRLRESEKVQFALIETKPSAVGMAPTLELVLANGELLRISRGADPEILRMVLEAVRR